jgi:DNA polymerase III delta prime subunit
MDIIAKEIVKSLKEGKWLYISYINGSHDLHFFWIAVLDIQNNPIKLEVKMYNPDISNDVFETSLTYENIKTAHILDFTGYDVPKKLLEKIESDSLSFSWLGYDTFNNDILSYYEECSRYDNDPCQKEKAMLPGIDFDVLATTGSVPLTAEQEDIITKKIIKKYNTDPKIRERSYFTLAFSRIVISRQGKDYVVAYNNVVFDPIKKTLELSKDIRFNSSFLVKAKQKEEDTVSEEDTKFSLFGYIDMDIDEFINGYKKDPEGSLEIIREGLHANETLDTRPYLMVLERVYHVNLYPTYQAIKEDYQKGELSYPMKAFFGNITNSGYRHFRSQPYLMIYDRHIDVDQLSVLYNAMRYPVTYVQGPPGTGKTQTLLNVILSAFYEGKTVLVCSGNNRPVDGIIQKLSFTYEGKEIPFPYLRLGNQQELVMTMKRILSLAQMPLPENMDEKPLQQMKEIHNQLMTSLLELLKQYDERKQYKEQKESLEKFISHIPAIDKNTLAAMNSRLAEVQEKIDNTRDVTMQDVFSLFKPISEDTDLQKWFYLESISFLSKIHQPRFQWLLDICGIQDENRRVMAFNQFCRDDEKLALLLNLFPIIFTTNISASKLGTCKTKFDLVVMDEAGQCNVADALLPIARGENLLLVGDQSQLKPVILIDKNTEEGIRDKYQVDFTYNYLTNSIMSVMRGHDNISKFIFLSHHYRCGKKIISFSNQRFYENKMKLDALKSDGELDLIDVKNVNSSNALPRSNYEEAKAIVDYVRRNRVEKTTILTPFVNQAYLINGLLNSVGISDVHAGTIHTMQGAENDTIILSPSISYKTSQKTYQWLKESAELINVGITRAKKKFIIAADTEAIVAHAKNQDDDLSDLIRYVRNNGNVSVPSNEAYAVEIGYSNGSAAEDEMYKTMYEMCTVLRQFKIVRNVKLKNLFPVDPDLSKSNQEFDEVLYVKTDYSGFLPKIAIEINGGEHPGDPKREYFDKKKREACQRMNIKLLTIGNSQVKDYEYLKELIQKIG